MEVLTCIILLFITILHMFASRQQNAITYYICVYIFTQYSYINLFYELISISQSQNENVKNVD
jgi:hypothetical protein